MVELAPNGDDKSFDKFFRSGDVFKILRMRSNQVIITLIFYGLTAVRSLLRAEKICLYLLISKGVSLKWKREIHDCKI
jgi:hypothetical protein